MCLVLKEINKIKIKLTTIKINKILSDESQASGYISDEGWICFIIIPITFVGWIDWWMDDQEFCIDFTELNTVLFVFKFLSTWAAQIGGHFGVKKQLRHFN